MVYASFKIGQRIIATIFSVTCISTYVLVIVMIFLNKGVALLKGILSEFQIDWIILLIFMFNFGAGLADSAMKKK